ncbi:transglycosylase SLT domain-containing protein [Methanococcoides sp. SA1]|nr:transglycosylase SLT domain-containing protein [Methanococcoides sp. SA1]
MEDFRGIVLFFGMIVMLSVVSAASFGGSNWQAQQPSFDELYSGDFENYWPILNDMKNDQCNATTDFIIGIPPGGCSPSVVRSDLLAEQNVPVFCELYAIKVNPLIKVSAIKSISFKGDYPEGVRSIVYHPARAAVKSYSTLLGDPTLQNIGYVVIILEQNKVEANMSDEIFGNLTATMTYDAEEAYGTGRSEYYLEPLSEEEWEADYEASSFWNGRGYLRVLDIEDGEVRVQVMESKDKVLRTLNLKEGETSTSSYLPGYYCKAGLKVKLADLTTPENMSLLNIDGQTIWVREGSKFLDGKCSVRDLNAKASNNGSISISCSGAGKISPLILTPKVSADGGNVLRDEGYNSVVDENFELSNDTVRELLDYYASEEKENGEKWGEEALYEQIVLAGQTGKFATQEILMGEFLRLYSTSEVASHVRNLNMKLANTNYSKSYTSVYVGDEFKSISVVGFKVEEEGQKRVDLRVGNVPYTYTEGEGKDEGKEWNLTVVDIEPGKVKVQFRSDKTGVKSESPWIKDGERDTFDGIDVYVENIEVQEVAHIELIPDVKKTKSEANFTFRIGIEQRAIELSPEKAARMIKNLNSTIAEWEDIVERLGGLVTGLKGACFATSAVLMVSNMFTGVDGTAAARQKVMSKYKTICDTDYKDMTRTECYNHLSGDIERDVVAMTAALGSVNDKLKSAQEGNVDSSGGLFGGEGIVDQEKYRTSLREQISVSSVEVEIGGEKVDVPVGELYSVSQLKAVMLWEEAEGVAKEVAKTEMDLALRNVALAVKGKETKLKLEEKFTVGEIKFPVSEVVDGKGTFANGGLVLSGSQLRGVVSGSSFAKVQDDDRVGVQIIHSGSRDYLYLFGEGNSQVGLYEIESNTGSGLVVNGKNLDRVPEGVKGVDVRIADVSGCSNAWGKQDAKVSYYEAGDNKGLPAIVPFDLSNGWYAMVPNSGGTFLDDTPQGYTASADVQHFKICNVGDNGLMQNCAGDDLVQTFNANTIGEVGSYGGCDVDVSDLYSKAREAIRLASSQYGEKKVNIFDEIIGVGEPMSQVGGFECQDFMSPENCKLMFNVCDPVICPASRCDLGGKMPVSDVIATGIIGSIALCLPNAKEGIFLPVCLSGIHAGLDSYLSILKSEKECLEHSIETGELVGICDEITSIYKCEFFWRQLSPLMDQLIPGVIDYAIGGGSVRGGGEYAFVEQSYNSMQQSISFFKDTYAQNAFRAFNIRSTQDVGSSVCKSFVGTSVPGSANFIDNLLEPESPSQFYAQFSESLFTEATVPSTSQYNVYYHIYAGNDQGVQYRIYLRDPPQTSYYASNPTVEVKRGYIAAGDSADVSEDFTAPSGYKELCVVINAKEECGFKQATSNFAIDYLAKKYTEEQALESDITSEKDCISGTSSALSMASLNLQSGAEEVLNPEIALRGIVRVCATHNPGSGVELNNDSRWKDVGYCGDASLRCWLDIDSVKDDLEALEAIDGASSSVLDERRGLIENARLSLAGVAELLGKARTDIKGLSEGDLKGETDDAKDIIAKLDSVIGVGDEVGAGTNGDRAEALSLKATVYRMIVGEGMKLGVEKGEVGRVEAGVDEEWEFGGEFEVAEDGEVNEVEPEVESGGGVEEVTNPDADFVKIIRAGVSGGILDGDCEQYASLIRTEAAKYEEFDELMLLAVMQRESSCDKDALSGSSYGLMQISSFEMCSDIGTREEILEDVAKNIECGALILKEKWRAAPRTYACDAFDSDNQNEPEVSVSYREIEYALRGYNGWGCAGVRSDGSEIFADHDYVEKVMGLYGELRGIDVSGFDYAEGTTEFDSGADVEAGGQEIGEDEGDVCEEVCTGNKDYTHFLYYTGGVRETCPSLDGGYIVDDNCCCHNDNDFSVDVDPKDVDFTETNNLVLYRKMCEQKGGIVIQEVCPSGVAGDLLSRVSFELENSDYYCCNYLDVCEDLGGYFIKRDSCPQSEQDVLFFRYYDIYDTENSETSKICCGVSEEVGGEILKYDSGVGEQGVVRFSATYLDGMDDFVEYRWNVDDGVLEWWVGTRGWLGIQYRTVCDWGNRDPCYQEMTEGSKEIHNLILSQKSWDDAVEIAKTYASVRDDFDLAVSFYDASEGLVKF